MTEAGWIQIVTLLLATVGPLLTLWVKSKLTDVHKELNSRLDQYKSDLAAKADAATVAAMAKGIAEGIDLERTRAADLKDQTARDVLKMAEGVAKQVILTAKEEKEKK